MTSPPTARYDEVAADYDAWVSASSPVLDDPTFAELLGPLPGSQVCVVACGQGRESRYLAGRGATVTGVDLSENLLAIAHRHEETDPLGITYRHGDAQTLAGLPDASFDGAVCYQALMDIPDLGRTLDAVARVLRPGGWFVFTITHPCFKTPATGELVDHATGTVRRTVGRYFTEGYWPGPGATRAALPVGAYHRTLSTYVNELTRAGLTLTQLREPPLDTPVWREVPASSTSRAFAHPADVLLSLLVDQHPGTTYRDVGRQRRLGEKRTDQIQHQAGLLPRRVVRRAMCPVRRAGR